MENEVRPLSFQVLRSQIQRGSGAKVWDSGGKSYIDFHAAYATLNQGHCHPGIVESLIDQARKLTLTSNSIQHDQLDTFARKITSTFHYERVIPMNTGSEACETALKYARRWGYEKKGVPANEALIVVPEGTYSGHSFSAISASTDQDLRNGFGPFLPGFLNVPYGDLEALSKALENPFVVALLLEPIQGEAGILLPPPGYLVSAHRLCRKTNTLLIADEIQTGMGRTGRLTACEHEDVRPDILLLGKALSGGLMPVSAVLCDRAVADLVGLGEHHSTFSGNPLACRVATAAIDALLTEDLSARALEHGQFFRQEVTSWNFSWLKEVRGVGLLNCVELAYDLDMPVWALSRALEEAGIIALPINKRIMRFSPPLVITEAEMQMSLEKIRQVFQGIQ